MLVLADRYYISGPSTAALRLCYLRCWMTVSNEASSNELSMDRVAHTRLLIQSIFLSILIDEADSHNSRFPPSVPWIQRQPIIRPLGPPAFNDIKLRKGSCKLLSGYPMYRTVIRRTQITGLFYAIRSTRSHHCAMSTKPHVGVIGAGFSGLRCADILVQNGARVTILEARDRVGGRVCSCSCTRALGILCLA